MEPTDLTIEVLKSIRDEVKSVRGEVTSVRDEVKATNVRLEELSRRVVESEIRTSTAITDLAGTVREMTTVLRAQSDLRPRVERCEREIDDLKRRAT
jgi:chromosome segregation ATPase